MKENEGEEGSFHTNTICLQAKRVVKELYVCGLKEESVVNKRDQTE